jgi:tryptophanyl-tRNA synthetase
MKRVLTGIQSSGIPHLGNILGAIVPAIELSKKEETESFIFIADFHSLTTIKDAITSSYCPIKNLTFCIYSYDTS